MVEAALDHVLDIAGKEDGNWQELVANLMMRQPLLRSVHQELLSGRIDLDKDSPSFTWCPAAMRMEDQEEEEDVETAPVKKSQVMDIATAFVDTLLPGCHDGEVPAGR